MNTILRMIKMKPNLTKLLHWSVRQGLIIPGSDDLSYTIHAVLKAAFGPHAPQPFYLLEQDNDLNLYGYVHSDGATLLDYAKTFAEPDVFGALGLEVLDALSVKEMPIEWKVGQCLGFEVRVCPTVRQGCGNDRDKSRERDAFLVACETADKEAPLNRAVVYEKWLSDKFSSAANLVPNSFQLFSFRLSKLVRRGSPNINSPKRPLQGIQGPDAILRGQLIIKDHQAFSQLLTRGVGRHRAFGFGMLLIRPSRKNLG